MPGSKKGKITRRWTTQKLMMAKATARIIMQEQGIVQNGPLMAKFRELYPAIMGKTSGVPQTIEEVCAEQDNIGWPANMDATFMQRVKKPDISGGKYLSELPKPEMMATVLWAYKQVLMISDAPWRHQTDRNFTTEAIQYHLKQQQWECNACHCKLSGHQEAAPHECAPWHADHIFPYARGGESVWWNCQILCTACNLLKNDKPPLAWAYAFFAKRGMLKS